MKFTIEEMITRTTHRNRTIFFNLPNGVCLVPQHLQPNNLSIQDRLSIHNDYFDVRYDYSKRNLIITFKPTSQTNKQLSTFVAECFRSLK